MRIRITSAHFWANAGSLPATLDFFQPHAHQGRLEVSRFDWEEVRPLLVATCGGEAAFKAAVTVVTDRVGADVKAAETESVETAVARLDVCGLALAAKHLTSSLKEATLVRERVDADRARSLVLDRLKSLAGWEISRLRAGETLAGSPLTPRDRNALRRFLAAGL